MRNEPAGYIGQFSFLFTGTMVTWGLGIRLPILAANQLAAALVLLSSLSLYEWARRAIWGKRFGLALGITCPRRCAKRALPLHPPSHLPELRARVPRRARRVATLDHGATFLLNLGVFV